MASKTSKEEALQLAQKFFAKTINKGLRSAVDLQLIYTDTDTSTKDSVGFYIYNAGANDGFVMISGDDTAKPVLAYSDKGSFPKGKILSNLTYWLDYYHNEMRALMQSKATPLKQKSTDLRSSHSAVEPLLRRIKWNQDFPYNKFAPLTPDSTENSAAGCVAIAMAQVMKYHQWPLKSNGVFEIYNWNFDFDNGISYIDTTFTNFGETTYRWEDMLDSYDGVSTLAQDSAVATLCYHCGVAVNMNYGAVAKGGSSTMSADVGKAMTKYFGYDPDMQCLNRDYYDQGTWSDMLMDELDAGRPILYSGSSKSVGHEFVCDGYDSEGLFHFNWGWGGFGDGYYVISVVDPQQNAPGGFVYGQDATIGIRKDDGIINPAHLYEMCMDYTSLTCNKPVLKSINQEKFSVNFGYTNYGWNTFSGKIGVAMYKDDSFLKDVAIEDSILLNSYDGSWNYQMDSLSLAGFADGAYRLYAVYQPNGSNSWFKLKDKTSLSNYVNVTISGDSAIFSNPDQGPVFIQTSDIVVKGDVYQNKRNTFNVTVKNNGFEFGSYMALYVCSTTGSGQSQYMGKVYDIIGKNETKTLEFSDILMVDTGTYNAYVVYDSLSNYSTYDYKLVDRTGYAPLQFNVLYYPGPELTINKPLNIVGGDSIYQNKPFSLDVEFRNLGSTYDNEVAIQLYPAESGFQVGQTGITPILVDSCSTKSYTLKGFFNVAPGSYRLCVFCTTKDGSWDRVMPTDPVQSVYNWYIRIKVLADPTDIEDVTTKGVRIGRNPVGESIEIITQEEVLQSIIFDINGRNLGQFEKIKTLPASNLKKGVYILRVKTDKGMTNVRFVK